LDPLTGQIRAWNPNADNSVFALAVAGNTVYAGGNFSSVGGQPRGRLVAIDATTAQVADWNPGADKEVRALAVTGDTVLVGGDFSMLGGEPRLALGAVTASGTVSDWAPGDSPANRVLAITVIRTGLAVGGEHLRMQGSSVAGSLALLPLAQAPVIVTPPQDIA